MIESTAPCTMPNKTSYIRVTRNRGYKLYLQALVLQNVFHGYHYQRKKVSGNVSKRLYPWIMQTFVIQSTVKRTSKHSDIINKNTEQDSLPASLPITYPPTPLRHTLARTDIFLTEPTDGQPVTVSLLTNWVKVCREGGCGGKCVVRCSSQPTVPSPCSHRPCLGSLWMDDSRPRESHERASLPQETLTITKNQVAQSLCLE